MYVYICPPICKQNASQHGSCVTDHFIAKIIILQLNIRISEDIDFLLSRSCLQIVSKAVQSAKMLNVG